jgi:hypothetical protein
MARHHHHNHHQAPAPAPDPVVVTPDPAPAPDPVVVTPDPTPSTPAAAPAFADLGVMFNDATRFLEGGLWKNVVEEGGQGFGSINNYTADLTAIQTGLQAEIAAGQFSGATLANVNTILADITTALAASTASVNNGGDFGNVAAAEAALRASHLDILNIVNNDTNLAGMATNADGVMGFMAAPQAFAAGTTAANAAKGTLADLGLIFNDAANHLIGGFNADNAAIVQNDVNVLITGLQDLVANNPLQFGGLSGVHANAVINQLELAANYFNTAQANVDLGRALNDNFLDIIDVINGDTNLVNLAHQGGVNGFAQFGDFMNPTPAYVDNQAQTNFWASFIAQSNALGQAAIAAVNAGDAAAIAQVTADLMTFQTDVTNFDAAQGGIFQARFDTELLGDMSTIGAEVGAILQGFATGNKALVAAAAMQMHANAADVGGNNVPITGGAYNGDGTTVAQVLATAVAASDASSMSADVAAMIAPAAAAAPAAQVAAVAQVAMDATPAAASSPPIDMSHMDMSHHYHHLWG